MSAGLTLVRAGTVRDVAQLYGVSVKTVYRWIVDGDMPCLQLHRGRGGYRIRQEHLDEFERRKMRNAEAPAAEPGTRPNPANEPMPLPVASDAFGRGRRAAKARAVM